MKKAVTSSLAAAVLGLTQMAAAQHAIAQDAFPGKPVHLVVPFSAGGGSDGLARAIQNVIETDKLLPVPLVITNAEGASGAVGTRQVLKADPDGYTILQIHQEMFSSMAMGRVDYSIDDFEPVIQVSEACMFMAVPKKSPVQDFEGFVAAVKKEGRGFKQADEIGGVTHFPSAELMKLLGTQWSIVPVGSTAKRFVSLKGGFTDMALMSPLWIKRGEADLRPLAMMSPERSAIAPDLPTAKELGYPISSCINRRYWAPKGTPAERIDVIADAIEKAAHSKGVGDYLSRTGEELKIVRGDALKQRVAAEFKSFEDVVDIVKGTSASK